MLYRAERLLIFPIIYLREKIIDRYFLVHHLSPGGPVPLLMAGRAARRVGCYAVARSSHAARFFKEGLLAISSSL